MTTVPLRVVPVPGTGAEDVLVDGSGQVWTGTQDGAIWRLRPDGGHIDRVADTRGRPLGLDLLPDGRILVADAKRGMLAVEPDTGRVEELVTAFEGRPLRFANNAAVAANGDVWFSDTSTKFGIEDWKADFAQDTRTGRLFRRTTDGAVTCHLDGLAFANGVALAPDDSFVLVAQTAARDLVRLWLTGERAGQRDDFCTDLPGYPDNISLGSDGLVWVALASPADAVVERIQRAPVAVRRLLTRLPEAVQPKPRRTARVQAFDLTGRLVHDLNADSTSWHMATGVREHHGQVWLGSLVEPAVAVLDLTAR